MALRIAKDVYVIIPVHNRVELTMACLAHLQNIGDIPRYSIIVVDDGSTDGTSAAIREAYPEVILLQGDGNLWWTGGIVKGMEHAYRQGAEYLIWLNDDCRPGSTTLRSMVEYAELNQNTIVAPAIYPENSSSPRSNAFKGRKKIHVDADKVYDADGISGYCVLIPRPVVDRIGFPDSKKFPHYSGDDTYTLRAKRAGFVIHVNCHLRADLVGPYGEYFKISDHIVNGASFYNSFNKTFSTIKSPFYLPSKFHYYIIKFGYLSGFLLFVIKLKYWLALFMWSYLRILVSKGVS